jgi:hypothetical protein
MSPNELQNIAGTFQLVGGIFFASAFMEPIVHGNFIPIALVAGSVLSGISFCTSFILAKKINSKLQSNLWTLLKYISLIALLEL